MQHHDRVFDKFFEEWLISFGLKEECDCSLSVTNKSPKVIIAKGYPLVSAGKDVLGYLQRTGDVFSCAYWPAQDVQDCANVNEGGEAWDISFKVNPTEKECNFVGCPKHLWRGSWRRRRRRGWRVSYGFT